MLSLFSFRRCPPSPNATSTARLPYPHSSPLSLPSWPVLGLHFFSSSIDRVPDTSPLLLSHLHSLASSSRFPPPYQNHSTIFRSTSSTIRLSPASALSVPSLRSLFTSSSTSMKPSSFSFIVTASSIASTTFFLPLPFLSSLLTTFALFLPVSVGPLPLSSVRCCCYCNPPSLPSLPFLFPAVVSPPPLPTTVATSPLPSIAIVLRWCRPPLRRQHRLP